MEYQKCALERNRYSIFSTKNLDRKSDSNAHECESPHRVRHSQDFSGVVRTELKNDGSRRGGTRFLFQGYDSNVVDSNRHDFTFRTEYSVRSLVAQPADY